MAGSHQHVIVRSCREQELSAHMLPPAFVDHSRSLRCPMPGQVRDDSDGRFDSNIAVAVLVWDALL